MATSGAQMRLSRCLAAAIVCCACLSNQLFGQTTQIRYLSGTGSDMTVNWEFKVSGGRNSGGWSTIAVPSNWEMQGFGTYRYEDDWSRDPVPDSVGFYRFRFNVPAAWQGHTVDIVFGGAMTDTEVRINGLLAGPVHQGGFYQFRYDVTNLLEYGGGNLLEAKVSRYSSNASVNRAERRADFWLFGGIYRPVWLEVRPPQHITRVTVDARHTGELCVEAFLGGISTADTVTARVRELDGPEVGSAFAVPVHPANASVELRSTLTQVEPWSAEWPHLYLVELTLKERGEVVHTVTERFGFRTVHVRPHDGLYVNDIKVRLKGVNRHSFWPTTGRATSKGLSVADANLIKDMNMNAVRMSHYPPDSHFLAVADSLGLYVIDELTGWQDAYDTEVGTKLVREMILRDVDHPAIILWANGNEGGWNPALVDEFAKWDPQQRTVIQPSDDLGGINTSHYEPYDCCPGTFFHGDDLFMPTEFLHGLYDGGHGAGLDDWWNLMLRNRLSVGGFLWALADEGIVRTDVGAIDVAGNRAPDGVVGPFREKEGSFYAIKEIWSPVYLELGEQDNLPPSFDGILRVENRYDNTNLQRVRFDWRLVDFPSPGSGAVGHTMRASGTAEAPAVGPQGVGELEIPLPPNWRQHDAFHLEATDPHGREIYTWTWMIPEPQEYAATVLPPVAGTGAIDVDVQGDLIALSANGIEVTIESTTARLHSVKSDGTAVSLNGGPRLVSGTASLRELRHYADGPDYVVEALFDGNMRKVQWRLLPSGWLQLDYAYRFQAGSSVDYLGVTFDYQEDQVTGIRWLGKGPYRVWKNRLKGVEFDVWEKAYNDAITGVVWDYPEFKGFHDDIYWATLETGGGMPITVVAASDNLFLRLFTPREPEGAEFDPRTTHVDFPDGDISLLHGIAPIGSKFHPATEHGPAGQPNIVPRLGRLYEATVYFFFGKLPRGGETP
jgi:hypothetical protein